MCQSCKCCHLVPRSSNILDLGGFLNFTKIIGWSNVATAMNLPQLCCLNETFMLPQIFLNNGAASIRVNKVIMKTT